MPELAANPISSAAENAPSEPVGIPSAPASAVADAAGSGTVSTGPSDARIAELHARLAASAERCYPAQARRFRQTGEVTLKFCLASGAADQISLDGSTGSPLLDEAARTCVLDGARPLPEITGCFAVPVRFGPPR
jgi:TonB family protein